jgi:hypothetical protein
MRRSIGIGIGIGIGGSLSLRQELLRQRPNSNDVGGPFDDNHELVHYQQTRPMFESGRLPIAPDDFDLSERFVFAGCVTDRQLAAFAMVGDNRPISLLIPCAW